MPTKTEPVYRPSVTNRPVWMQPAAVYVVGIGIILRDLTLFILRPVFFILRQVFFILRAFIKAWQKRNDA